MVSWVPYKGQMGSFKGNLGVILGSFGGNLGVILGSSKGHLGVIYRGHVVSYRVHVVSYGVNHTCQWPKSKNPEISNLPKTRKKPGNFKHVKNLEKRKSEMF